MDVETNAIEGMNGARLMISAVAGQGVKDWALGLVVP